MTWGTTLFEAQALTWNMSIPDIAESLSGGIFLQDPGGIPAVPLVQQVSLLFFGVNIDFQIDCLGRLPVLFWSQLLSYIMVVAVSQAPT